MTYGDGRDRVPEGAKGLILRDTIAASSLNTPDRGFSTVTTGFDIGSSSRNNTFTRSHSTPVAFPPTPSSSRNGEKQSTPASRRAVIAKSFSELSFLSPERPMQPPPTPSREGSSVTAGFSTVRQNNTDRNFLDDETRLSPLDDLPRVLFPAGSSARTPQPQRATRNNSSSTINTLESPFVDTDGSSSGWSIPSTSSFRSEKSTIQKRAEQPGDHVQPNEATPVANSTGPVAKFLSRPLGVDLDPFIIAHNRSVQALLDREEIAWGVQYEIARGITQGLWDWPDVRLKIGQLKGSNEKVAPKVRSILLNQPVKVYDPALWQELDREQRATVENLGRGLGLMGTWQEEKDWYGGRIQQLARLIHRDGTYKILLEPMEKRRSHRLARYLGSRRVLQVHVPDEGTEEVKMFLLHKFILCGRVNENYERNTGYWCGDNFRKPFKDIINWHNPLDLNAEQPMSKWSSRFALVLSNSIPILEFKEKNIFFIKDICSSSEGKPPAEKIHTDGCGFINEAGLKIITRTLNCPGRPTAIQGRIIGSKGLWILHPSDKDPEPRIWIRDSQRKIIYQSPVHRSHLILDLVSISRESMSVSLSTQTIMNLFTNGVPYGTLEELLLKGLTDQVKPLMDWEGPRAMEVLFQVISHLGGASRTRLQRVIAGLGRILGIQRREWREEDIGAPESEDESSKMEEPENPYTGRNEYSGAPVALHELAMELLQAGFHPKTSQLLKDKLRYVVQSTIESMIEKFSIPLPESLSGFITPDPIGILKEGEAYYRSSQPLTDPETQTLFNVVTGNVLIGRYPVYLPSDIQKVKMVDYPELSDYSDVLIVSTNGAVSFASLLSGGDYDGDEVFIIRERSLVGPFQSKPLAQMPTNFMEDNFERDIERVERFATRALKMQSSDSQAAFQMVLLRSLEETKFGLYSAFHTYSTYIHGYADRQTVRLAYMFNTLLDAGKSGLRLKPEVFQTDEKCYSSRAPEPTWGSSLRPWIFRKLRIAGKNASDELLRDFDTLTGSMSSNARERDPVLEQPYQQAKQACRSIDILNRELRTIEAAVERVHQSWTEANRKLARTASNSETPQPPNKKRKKTRKREPDVKMHVCRLYNEEIPNVVIFQNVKEIKASYAYIRDPKFAFGVAFRDMCIIKASAAPGGLVPSIRSFDEARTIPTSYVRALARLPMA